VLSLAVKDAEDATVMVQLYTTKRTAPNREDRAGIFPVAARGFAAFIGVFTLLNLIGEIRAPGCGFNVWWIDFRPIPGAFSKPVMYVFAAFMLAYSALPVLRTCRKKVTLVLTILMFGFAVWNTVHYYVLLASGSFRTSFPVPLSILIVGVLAVLVLDVVRSEAAPGPKPSLVLSGFVFALCLVTFPLLQMFFFGKTDYRRKAEVIVVFGAGVFPDGTLSDALADRVRTACDLYHKGYSKKLLFSGGPGPGEIHEVKAMLRYAVSLGVPENAVMLDRNGLNTFATVRNTQRMLGQINARTVLAVSHFYHLPRIKMPYHREGLEVYTVPAKERYTLTAMPYLMAREVAALWFYYLRMLAA
jgi:uncharacterized SAM-binding protein YcdF (DUF218 family)